MEQEMSVGGFLSIARNDATTDITRLALGGQVQIVHCADECPTPITVDAEHPVKSGDMVLILDEDGATEQAWYRKTPFSWWKMFDSAAVTSHNPIFAVVDPGYGKACIFADSMRLLRILRYDMTAIRIPGEGCIASFDLSALSETIYAMQNVDAVFFSKWYMTQNDFLTETLMRVCDQYNIPWYLMPF